MTHGTYITQLRRLFLIKDLPEPLTRSSSHLQIFDNYIENTRLRIRSIRSPETKQWNFSLEQRFPADENDFLAWKIAEIKLNEAEHAVFELFEGREIRKNERIESSEIRKNRYFYEFDGRQLEIDVYLGDLWGLNTAKATFETLEEMRNFKIPPFFLEEITNNPFFIDENLISKNFADVQTEFERISNS